MIKNALNRLDKNNVETEAFSWYDLAKAVSAGPVYLTKKNGGEYRNFCLRGGAE